MVDVACAKAGCFITIDATAGETRARTRTIRNIGFMRVIIKATFLSVQRDPHNKHQHGEQPCLGIVGVFGIVAYLAAYSSAARQCLALDERRRPATHSYAESAT